MQLVDDLATILLIMSLLACGAVGVAYVWMCWRG